MSLTAVLAMIVASPLDDIALALLCASHTTRSATFSEIVAGGIGSPANPTERIMASKINAQPSQSEVDRIVEQLKAARGTKRPGNLVDRLADLAADSGRDLSRIGAGFSAAYENAGLSFAAERERQTRRTAERLLALARG
jgi:hypothetical protein